VTLEIRFSSFLKVYSVVVVVVVISACWGLSLTNDQPEV